jgi:tRNA (guanosine-2'-O-)-methyltransferase
MPMTPERMQRMEAVVQYRQPDLTVVLENVFDPHNLAAVMRTCDAVGVREVFAITDRIPLRRNWGYRSSRSANKWVELHSFSSRDACLQAVRQRYRTLLASSLQEGSGDLYSLDLTGSLALVFGNEKFGVSEGMQQACDGYFRIPQVGMIHSLNISVACAVTLYEAYRQRKGSGQYAQPRLAEHERLRLLAQWGMEQRGDSQPDIT